MKKQLLILTIGASFLLANSNEWFVKQSQINSGRY